MQKHLMVQQPDGWFGRELHGVDGMDCHIRGLLKLGVEAVTVADVALAPDGQGRIRLTVRLEYQGTELLVSLTI